MFNLFYILDLLGIFIFSISGASVALNKRFDLFGALFVGCVTAVGGGTIRDVIIGDTPVFWLNDVNYAIAIMLGVTATAVFKTKITKLTKTLFFFDSIGLGICTVVGVSKGMQADLHPMFCVLLGIVTGTMGGVLRDTFCNKTPLIFKSELYATASCVGGLLYLLSLYFSIPEMVGSLGAIAAIFFIRLWATVKNISLPSPKL